MNEDTYEITEEETVKIDTRKCNVFEININDGKDCKDGNEVKVTAYRYTDNDTGQDKISLYATTNDGVDSVNPIYQDLWYIKLTVKEDEKGPYIYINFIRTLNLILVDTIKNKIIETPKKKITDTLTDTLTTEPQNFGHDVEYIYSFKVEHLLNIVEKIAKKCSCYKIFLQDDAEFPCNNEVKYGIKALQLRALNKKVNIQDLNTLSIYNRHGFTISKYQNTDVVGCIQALQEITCQKLKEYAVNLRKLLIRINEKDMTINIQKMTIKDDDTQSHDLKIEYSIVNEIDHSSICEQYIKNLDSLIGLFKTDEITGKDKIGDLYDKFCKEGNKNVVDEKINKRETPDCCGLRGKLLGCLRNSINSYVIVISGNKNPSNQNKATCCDSNLKDMKDDGSKIFRKKQATPPLLTRASTQPQQQTTPPIPQQSVSEPVELINKTPIIVTKLFNLFSGTFERLTYMFFHMENILPKNELQVTQ